MKTLDETFDLVENLNELAHEASWDHWIEADEADDEEMREDASDEQSSYFRDYIWELEENDQESIEHWITNNKDFRDQFRDWYGHEYFDDEYGDFND